VGDLLLAIGSYAPAAGILRPLDAAPWRLQDAGGRGDRPRAAGRKKKTGQALAAFNKVLAKSEGKALKHTMRPVWAKPTPLVAMKKPERGHQCGGRGLEKADPEDAPLMARAYDISVRRSGRRAHQGGALAFLHVDVLYAAVPDAHAEALANLVDLWQQVHRTETRQPRREDLMERYPESPGPSEDDSRQRGGSRRWAVGGGSRQWAVGGGSRQWAVGSRRWAVGSGGGLIAAFTAYVPQCTTYFPQSTTRNRLPTIHCPLPTADCPLLLTPAGGTSCGPPSAALDRRACRVACGDAGVAEHLLDLAKIGAAHQQMRGEAVPQRVRTHFGRRSRAPCITFQQLQIRSRLAAARDRRAAPSRPGALFAASTGARVRGRREPPRPPSFQAASPAPCRLCRGIRKSTRPDACRTS